MTEDRDFKSQEELDAYIKPNDEEETKPSGDVKHSIVGPRPRVPQEVSDFVGLSEPERKANIEAGVAADQADLEATRERTRTERYLIDPISAVMYGTVTGIDAFATGMEKGANLVKTAASNIVTGRDFDEQQMRDIANPKDTRPISTLGGSQIFERAESSLPAYAEIFGKIGHVVGDTAAMIQGGKALGLTGSRALAAGAAMLRPDHPVEAAAEALVFAKVAGFSGDVLRGVDPGTLRRFVAEAVAVYGTDVAMQFAKSGAVDWESPIGAALVFGAHSASTEGSILSLKRPTLPTPEARIVPDEAVREQATKPENATETAPEAAAESVEPVADRAGQKGAFSLGGIGPVIAPGRKAIEVAGDAYRGLKDRVVETADAFRGDVLAPLKRAGSKAYDVLARLTTAGEKVENLPKIVADEVGSDPRIGAALDEGQLRGIEAQRIEEARGHLEKAKAAKVELEQNERDIADEAADHVDQVTTESTSAEVRAKLKAEYVATETKRQADETIGVAESEFRKVRSESSKELTRLRREAEKSPDDPTIEEEIAKHETAIEDAKKLRDATVTEANRSVRQAQSDRTRVGYEAEYRTQTDVLRAQAKADRDARRSEQHRKYETDEEGNRVLVRRSQAEILRDIHSGERDNLKSIEEAAQVGTVVGERGVFKTAEEVDAYRKSPEFQAAGAAWQRNFDKYIAPLYDTLTNADPTVEKPGRDPLYGFRKNLKAIREGEGAKYPSVVSSRRIGGPELRSSPFARRATGHGTYESDIEESFRHSLGQLVPALRKQAVDALISEGNGKWAEKGKEKPEGWATVRLDKDYGLRLKDAKGDDTPSRTMYLRPDFDGAVEGVFGVNKVKEPRGLFGLLSKAVTKTATKTMVEPLAHMTNQETSAFNMAGPSGVYRWLRDARRFAKDPILKAKAILRLSEIGASRPEFKDDKPLGDLAKLSPFKKVQAAIHDSDLAARILVLDHVEDMIRRGVAPDTLATRRDAVNKAIGNYNELAQTWAVRVIRKYTGPFYVAGSTFTGNAFRRLAGSQGVAATLRGQMEMRAKVYGRWAITLGSIAAWNFLKTDKFFPKGVRPWEVVTGKEDGRWVVNDSVGRLSGLTQMAHHTGMAKVYDDLRSDQPENIGVDVFNSIARRMFGTLVGPGASTIAKATGFKWDDFGPSFKPSGASVGEAAVEANSIVYAIHKAYTGDDTADESLFGTMFLNHRGKSDEDVDTAADRREKADAYDEADATLLKMLKQPSNKREDWLSTYVESQDWPDIVKARTLNSTRRAYSRWIARGDK